MQRHNVLAEILSQPGMVVRIARACGVGHSTVSGWTHVPTRHIRTVAELTGVAIEQLVPQAGARRGQVRLAPRAEPV